MNEEPNYAEIGRRQAESRKLLGLTQAEMADKIGVPMRTISDNERGISVAGGRVLAAYCDLGIRSDWLLTGQGKPFSHDAPPSIQDLVEVADNGQVPLAHFERTDMRPSYLVGAGERRSLSRLSLGHELCSKICETGELGLPNTFRLFTISDNQHGLFIVDGAITRLTADGLYALILDNEISARHIQLIDNEQLAIMRAGDASRIDNIKGSAKVTAVGLILGSLSACRTLS